MVNYSLEEYLGTPLAFEEGLMSYFDRASQIVIFDIGACEGEDSIKYARIFPQATIYAFEPLPSNVEKARANLQKYNAANVQLETSALSNEVGETKFYISSGKPQEFANVSDWDFGNKSSSLLKPDKVTEYHQWLSFKEEITVKTDTIKNFCTNNKLANVDFIHMDVQGAELLVLEGAQDLLSEVKLVWLEVEAVSLYKNQPLKNDVEAFMAKHRFIKIYDQVDAIAGDQLYVSSAYHHKRFSLPLMSQIKHFLKRQLASIPIIKNILLWKHQAFQYTEWQKTAKYYQQSYSQCGEDLIVRHIFENLGIKTPSYLDVGAHHPYYLSNTALFYQNGSRGINIEPDPTLFKVFQEFRTADTNLNIGIGDETGLADFYIIAPPTLNTFSKEEAENYVHSGAFSITSVQKIEVHTIQEVLAKHSSGVFPQFLTIDAEGVDELIIKKIDFEKNYPLVICIETISFSTSGNGVKNTEIINFLNSKGYLTYADTNINTIFVRREAWERKG
jgi:FkbM family methyltransferase